MSQIRAEVTAGGGSEPTGALSSVGQRQPVLGLRRYFQRNVFVHTHIEKTGGSSLVWGLRRLLGDDHVYDTRGAAPAPHDLPPAERAQIWLLTGHFWFDTAERAIARRKRYFMILRDPVDRFVSYYNFVSENKGHPAYAEYGALDLEGAYRALRKRHPRWIFNRTAAMFVQRAGGTPPARPRRILGSPGVSVDEVIALVERHYALVVPMSRIDDAVRGIGAAFGVEIRSVARKNISTTRSVIIPERIRRELRKRNSEDYQMMSHFEAVFDRRLRDLPARLMR